MRAIIRLICLSAARDRLFSGLAAVIFLVFGLALFAGNNVVLEQSETGAVYASGVTRNVLILGLVMFVAFQTQRLFEAREIEAILSRSLSRTKFVVACWAGFGLAATALVMLVAAMLFVLYGLSLATFSWSASLLLECLVVLSFAQFAALTFERATSTVFVTLSFYAFTRLIGFFLGIRDATPAAGPNVVLNPMVDILALIVPRLDLMTQTSWLVYGFEAFANVPLVLVQAIVFILLTLAAAAFDLHQKQF